MVKYSLCLEMVFQDQEFLERIESARAFGFNSFEFWSWEEKSLTSLEELVEGGMEITNFSAHRKGSLIDPMEWETYIGEVTAAIEVAKRLKCPRLMLLTDELEDDDTVQKTNDDLTDFEKSINMIENLKSIAKIAHKEDFNFVLEPLNTNYDHMGYYLDSCERGFEIIEAVGDDRITILYDIYHMQLMEGNIINTLENHLDQIGYIHAADVPGRNEPGTGEINYVNIFRRLEEMGYDGYVGFEFLPKESSEIALGRLESLVNEVQK